MRRHSFWVLVVFILFVIPSSALASDSFTETASTIEGLSTSKQAVAYCAVPDYRIRIGAATVDKCVKIMKKAIPTYSEESHNDLAIEVAKVVHPYCSKSGNRKKGETKSKCVTRVAGSTTAMKAAVLGAAAPPAPSPSNPGNGKIGSPSSLGIPALSIGDIGTNIVNILTFIAGAISTIFIAIGGIRYSTSNGNQDQIKSAKHTLQYAVTGLIVSLLAYGIVAFVLAYSPKP